MWEGDGLKEEKWSCNRTVFHQGFLLYCVDLSRAGAPCVRSCIIKPGNGPATDCERYMSVSLYACSCTLHDDTKGRLMGVFAGSPGMLVV